MVADISCKTSVFCTEITAQKGHYLENWTVSFSMTGGHFSSLGLGLECLGVLDKHQQRIYWAQINQDMYQRCTLLLRCNNVLSCLNTRRCVDLWICIKFYLSAVLRSLLRLGAEFEIFAGCGTVCCSSKITMTMARDLRPSLPLQRRTCGL